MNLIMHGIFLLQKEVHALLGLPRTLPKETKQANVCHMMVLQSSGALLVQQTMRIIQSRA